MLNRNTKGKHIIPPRINFLIPYRLSIKHCCELQRVVVALALNSGNRSLPRYYSPYPDPFRHARLSEPFNFNIYSFSPSNLIAPSFTQFFDGHSFFLYYPVQLSPGVSYYYYYMYQYNLIYIYSLGKIKSSPSIKVTRKQKRTT